MNKDQKQKTKNYLTKKGWKIISESFKDEGYSFLFKTSEKEYKITLQDFKLIFNSEEIKLENDNLAVIHRKISSLVKKNEGTKKESTPKKSRRTKKINLIKEVTFSSDLMVNPTKIESLIYEAENSNSFKDITMLLLNKL